MPDQPPYRLIACDLDDTLAETKQAIDPAMAETIGQLLKDYDFCIISGGTFEQIKTNVIDRLPPKAIPSMSRIHVMPTSGASYYRFNVLSNIWEEIYRIVLTKKERESIMYIIEQTVRNAGIWEKEPRGEIIQDRISQITFSALGQLASPEAKRAWDPKRIKRNTLRSEVARALPNYEVVINGNTSIDVLKQGIDKGYGIKKLIEYCQLAPHEVIFFGDSLLPGGNDYPVTNLEGVSTMHVKDRHETLHHLSKFVSGAKERSV